MWVIREKEESKITPSAAWTAKRSKSFGEYVTFMMTIKHFYGEVGSL